MCNFDMEAEAAEYASEFRELQALYMGERVNIIDGKACLYDISDIDRADELKRSLVNAETEMASKRFDNKFNEVKSKIEQDFALFKQSGIVLG